MSNWPRTLGSALSALTLALVWASSPAVARGHHYHHAHAARARLAAWGTPTDPAKDAALILDGETGRTLYTRNAAAERHPASLTEDEAVVSVVRREEGGRLNHASVVSRPPPPRGTAPPHPPPLRWLFN